MLRQLVGEQVFDEVLLHLAERHDADAALRQLVVAEAAHHFLDDGFGLGTVAARASVVVGAVDGYELHLRGAVVDRGEGVEFALVVLCVGEGDEALVARTVVPRQVACGQRERDAVVEDALHVVDVGLFFVNGIGGEETCRRHLLRVAHTDEGLAAGNGADSLGGGHLRCLVEADDVERRQVEVDELSHGDGAHEHDRTELGQQRGYLVHDVADGGAAAVGGDVALQDAQFGDGRGLQRLRRHVGCQFAIEHLLREFLELLRHVAIFRDGIFEEQTVEHLQLRLAVDDLQCHVAVGALEHGLGRSMGRRALVVHEVYHLFQMQLLQLALADAPLCPVATAAECLLPLRDESFDSGEVLVVEVAERLYFFNTLQQTSTCLHGGRRQGRHG